MYYLEKKNLILIFSLGQERNDCKKYGPGKSINTISIPKKGLMITI